MCRKLTNIVLNELLSCWSSSEEPAVKLPINKTWNNRMQNFILFRLLYRAPKYISSNMGLNSHLCDAAPNRRMEEAWVVDRIIKANNQESWQEKKTYQRIYAWNNGIDNKDEEQLVVCMAHTIIQPNAMVILKFKRQQFKALSRTFDKGMNNK